MNAESKLDRHPLRSRSFGHFIALLSSEGDRFQIGDPLSRAELLARYEFTGFYMLVTKDK